MANPTTNFNWQMPTNTDLVKDLPADFEVFGQAVDTSLMDLKGGTTGQILSKASNTDMDFTWIANDQGDITAVTAGTGISGGGTSGAVTITNSMATAIDAKADLIVGTGSDAFDRLAVGSNGQSIFADSSQTTGLRYNPPVASLGNVIINSGFDVWQRGTSLAGGAFKNYTADRWTLFRAGTTISRQATGDTTNLPNIRYCARVQRDSGTTGTSANYLQYSVETADSIQFAGKAVTLSFYARKGANYSATSSGLVAGLYSGTGTDQALIDGFTGSALVAQNTVSLTTTWQRFVITGTIATTATELGVEFVFTPTGTAGAADYYEVTGVQLDIGTWTASTAPTFRRYSATLAGELQAAQRYYYVAVDGANKSISMAAAYGANNAFGVIPFKVSMRTAPTLVQTTGTNYYTLVGNNTSDSFDSFQAINDAHSEACRLDVTSGIASTQLGAYWFISASASARLAFSAEL